MGFQILSSGVSEGPRVFLGCSMRFEGVLEAFPGCYRCFEGFQGVPEVFQGISWSFGSASGGFHVVSEDSRSIPGGFKGGLKRFHGRSMRLQGGSWGF